MSEKRTLVIIEDEIELLNLLHDFFEPHFDEIKIALDGRTGFDLIRYSQPSLILTDLTMPNMDGVDMITQARAQGMMSPVVFITGRQDPDFLLTGMRLGVLDVVYKPFNLDQLHTTLERVLQERERWAKIEQMKSQQPNAEELMREQRMIGLLQAVRTRKAV